MKNRTILISGSIIVVIALLFLFGKQGGPGLLEARDFVRTYQSTPGAVLVDVRTPAEFDAGHLVTAINIDFENPHFVEEVKKLDRATPYFVYCRSGNRSAQSVAIMQKIGIKNIYELQGGLVSSVGALTLTTDTSSSSEYVVDEGDMVKGDTLVRGNATSVLNKEETSGLVQMREEEKLAHDVYITLGEKWGVRIFSNIAGSEQTHTDAVKILLDRYGITDPVTDTTVGIFRSTVMQGLYRDLVAQGEKSERDAIIVGATVEDLDIRDLSTLKNMTKNEDILRVYNNLQKGSRNHLRGFLRNLPAGSQYVPQYITQTEFDAIMSGSQERGRV